MTKIIQTEIEKQLLDASMPYLKSFILESGGFYPFAMIINKRKVISSLYPEIDNNYPESQYLIDLYKKCIYNEYSKLDDEYLLAIICVDVFINESVDDRVEKKNGVEFNFIAPNYERRIQYLYETNDNNDIKFIEVVNL